MIKIICTLIGTFIGAGFASGKEIHLFFFRYGFYGIIGIFFSSFFIFLILLKTIKIIKKNNINNYDFFIEKIIKNKKIKQLLNKVINIFLIFSFYIMISGMCTFLQQELCIDKALSGLAVLAICYNLFQKNINKIIKINNFLIPIIIILILYFLLFKINNFEIFYIKNNYKNNIFFSDFFEKLFSAFLYSNYNLLAIIPVLVAMKKLINKKIYVILIPLFIGAIICILSLAIFLLLSRLGIENRLEVLNLDMPMIYVVSSYGFFYRFIYSVIIGIAIFTTAISSGYGYIKKGKESKRKIEILILGAIIFIPVSFSRLIRFLYPIFGIVGIIQSYYILRYRA